MRAHRRLSAKIVGELAAVLGQLGHLCSHKFIAERVTHIAALVQLLCRLFLRAERLLSRLRADYLSLDDAICLSTAPHPPDAGARRRRRRFLRLSALNLPGALCGGRWRRLGTMIKNCGHDVTEHAHRFLL
jgi:hypothetical protein